MCTDVYTIPHCAPCVLGCLHVPGVGQRGMNIMQSIFPSILNIERNTVQNDSMVILAQNCPCKLS